MEYPIEGVKIEELEKNEAYTKFLSKQNAYKQGFIRLLPYNQIMPKEYIKYAKRIHNFDIRQDDVWISSFPKCGKTVIFLIPHCLSQKNVVQTSRVIFNLNQLCKIACF